VAFKLQLAVVIKPEQRRYVFDTREKVAAVSYAGVAFDVFEKKGRPVIKLFFDGANLIDGIHLAFNRYEFAACVQESYGITKVSW
jgi:hypothetical protein